jgi:predicted nucleic acid-binding Zn ribbon protein
VVQGRDPITISSSLDGVVRSLRGPSRAAVGGVFGRWAEAVGPQVADHVTPLKLDEGVLVVEVDDPAWATQVRFLTAMIIERLVEVAGVTVERIEVRVDRRNALGARYP